MANKTMKNTSRGVWGRGNECPQIWQKRRSGASREHNKPHGHYDPKNLIGLCPLDWSDPPFRYHRNPLLMQAKATTHRQTDEICSNSQTGFGACTKSGQSDTKDITASRDTAEIQQRYSRG